VRRNNVWRHDILGNKFRNSHAEMGIKRTAGCKNKDQWHKIGIYAIKYKDK
jgi:hypothetical protein